MRRSTRPLATAFASAVLGLASCRAALEPMIPAGAEPFDPPSVYATWWAMTQACAGVSSSLDRVQWYVLPRAEVVPFSGRRDVTGYWTSAGNTIVLAGAGAFSGGNVRHEMLHALLRVPGHPRGAFLERCGGVVDCYRECIADAGPPAWTDPAIPIVNPDQLRLGLVVAPAAPSAQIDSGFFAVIVTVTNPADHPVVVSLPKVSGTLGRAFTYRLQGPLGGVGDYVNALDAADALFAAAETKRHVFEVRVARDSLAAGLRPGEYTVAGSFGLAQPWASQQVVLRP